MSSKYFSQLTLQDLTVICGDSMLGVNHNSPTMKSSRPIKSTPSVMSITDELSDMIIADPPPRIIPDDDEYREEEETPKKKKRQAGHQPKTQAKTLLKWFLNETNTAEPLEMPEKWIAFKTRHNLSKFQIEDMLPKLSIVQAERSKLHTFQPISDWVEDHPDAKEEFEAMRMISDMKKLERILDRYKNAVALLEFRIWEIGSKFTYGNLYDLMSNGA